ncbi:MAG: response regulator [Acidobacteriota bacterium]
MSDTAIKVLLIEDNRSDVLVIRQMLGETRVARFQMECTSSLATGLARLAAGGIDVVLLDLSLPDSEGLDTFTRLHRQAQGLPVVVLTGLNDEAVAAKAVRLGAQDYLVKGQVDGNLLGRALRYALERQRAAERIRLQSAALEAAASAIVITDDEGRIIWTNPAFWRLTGYGPEEAIGQTPRLLKSGQHDPAFYKNLWETILSGDVWRGEIVNRRKDGGLYTEEQTITPLRETQGKISHFIAIKQDVTERNNLQKQFLQAQKLEAVGQLAAGVAHDFNNLLTVVLGNSALLLSQLHAKDPRRHEIKQIGKAAERGASLTRQLLAFSRKQVLEPEVLGLNQVVADLQKMLRRLIGEDIELVTVLDPELGRVKVDPGQIEQVLMNLAVNARDAMPQGGRLTVETANQDLGEDYAATHVPVVPGRYVMLAVSDTGRGMDAKTQERIFEPFFTTKEDGKGTGLGLSTVYGIVKQSGGYIWVYSEPGQGAVFKIYLPRTEEAVPEPSRTARRLHRGRETVLVVEDEEEVRATAARILRDRGYTVLEARDGQEALKIGEGESRTIHLIITDVVMPGMSGHRLAERLGESRPEMRVLYMSGYTDSTIVRHGVSAGHQLLQKPFTPEVLASKVRQVLDTGGQ